MHANPITFVRKDQIRLVGKDHFKTENEDEIMNNIGITLGIGRQAARVYTRNGLVFRERDGLSSII